MFPLVFAVKKHPKLKSKYEGCVQAAIEYASTIEDFDELVDARTLACHCLGPEPSHYVLRAEKSKLIWDDLFGKVISFLFM